MFNMGKSAKQEETTKYDRIHVVKSPGDALADMIFSPPEGSVKTQITPKLAQQMLSYNINNRPVSQGTVSHYSRQMKSGDWHYTRVPIIFSASGRILDGQHRLMAIVDSGATITADVAFGAPDEAFAFVDIGKKRTGGDVFAINGVKNHNAMAAITRFLASYVDGFSLANNGGGTYTPDELYQFYAGNPDVADGMATYFLFAKCRLAKPAIMAGLYVVCARKCRRDADRFFEVAAEGLGATGKNDPAFTLHKKFIEAATSGDGMGRKATVALTIEAWNRMRAGLSGRGLKYDPESPMPRVR